MNRQDWIWGLLSILGIGMGTAIVIAIAPSVFESFSPSPPFLSFYPSSVTLRKMGIKP